MWENHDIEEFIRIARCLCFKWISKVKKIVFTTQLVFQNSSKEIQEKKQKLDLFKEIKGVDESRMHCKFSILKNEVQLKNEKRMLSAWTEGMVDKDKKLVREFQETFHSSFWEIFLFKLFRQAGFEIDQSHQMPDFVIKKPIEVYVEAVVANIKYSGRKEEERTIQNLFSAMQPPYLQSDFYDVIDEAIIRASNAIKSKKDKYIKQYSKYDWVKNNNPFIIALGS